MRNGVLAIDREGGIVLLNDEARRLFHLKPGPVVGLPYADVLREHPDIVRVLGGAFELKSLPNRAELRLKSTDTVIGYTLSLVRDDDGDAGRRGAVLQGPHARRADRGARAPARSAGRGRRDGRGDGARDQEPARRHRGAGRAAAPQGAGQPRGAGARQGHHQRSQDGQRDRPGSAGVRAAGAAAGRSHVARRGAGQRGVAGRRQGDARQHPRRRRSCPPICRRSAPTSIS